MTRIDTHLSQYKEAPDVRTEFDRSELRRLRFLMRRLQYLEQQIRERGGMAAPDATGGGAFAEMEVEALEYVLTEVGYLQEREG